MRVRVRYAKTGKLRFVSATDLGRIWERALRRADLPIAYSEGFSPHPRVSFPDALPLGYASTGEYAELTFAAPVEPRAAALDLNAAFAAVTSGGDPAPGLRLLDVAEVTGDDPRLAGWLAASLWELRYPGRDGLPAALAAAVAAMRAADRLPVARQRKGAPTTVDLRPALHEISSAGASVRVTLHHVEPPLRPTEVDLVLRQYQPDLPAPALTTRVAQGRPVAGGLVEALSGEFVGPLARPHPTEGTTSDQ